METLPKPSGRDFHKHRRHASTNKAKIDNHCLFNTLIDLYDIEVWWDHKGRGKFKGFKLHTSVAVGLISYNAEELKWLIAGEKSLKSMSKYCNWHKLLYGFSAKETLKTPNH